MTPTRHSPPDELLRGEPRVLRPSRIRVTVISALSAVFAAWAFAATLNGVLLGIAGVVIGLGAFIASLTLMLVPNSLVLVYDDECFATYNSLGRALQRVRWSDIDELTEIERVGWGGMKVVRHLAWRARRTDIFGAPCSWTGGTDIHGRPHNGALLHPYADYEELHELFTRMIHQSRARESAPAALGGRGSGARVGTRQGDR